MSKKSLIKEQIPLLRTEAVLKNEAKRLKKTGAVNWTAITASCATLVPIAAAASGKLGTSAPIEISDEIQAALASPLASDTDQLVTIAEIISRGHASIQGLAEVGGMQLLPMVGGTNKSPPLLVIQSILGIG